MDIKERIDHDIVVIRRPLIEKEKFRLQQLRQIPGILRENQTIFSVRIKFRMIHDGASCGDYKILEHWFKGGKGLVGVDIDILRAWRITTGHREVVVGVIDTGVDFSSPDLKDNAWWESAEQNGKPGIDDDGNGYVDDLHGFDFYNNKSKIIDDNGHGTHVAGVIGARGDNGFGVAGINWRFESWRWSF